jgi:UDP-glucose 4-epimerase
LTYPALAGVGKRFSDGGATSSTCLDGLAVSVWGACGFLGSHLVSRLIDTGATVTVIVRSRGAYPYPPWASKVRWLEMNGSEDGRLALMEAAKSSSVVYNLAGQSGAVASNRDPLHNLDSTCAVQLNFLEACAQSGSQPHVIFTSSRLVYGHSKRMPVSETQPLGPLSMYAAHKLCVEHYHQIFQRRGAISYTICRLSNAFGDNRGSLPASNFNVLNNFIRQAVSGSTITLFGDGGQLRDYIYVNDVVDAFLLCVTSRAARNETFNIGAGKGITIRDATTTIQQIAGAPPISFASWPQEYEWVETGSFVADIRKAQLKLGFAPRYSFRSGVAAVVSAYRCSQTYELPLWAPDPQPVMQIS